ncbi:MAG: GNAT family N-acetyltransferase [Chloroflexi bacterium]|nr:GNAT family N-acetyltransferase [Chloroflexota bacterium]
MNIRSFNATDAEYEAIYAIEKVVFPENADTVADFKHSDASRPTDQFFQRLVVEQNGRITAFASMNQPPQSDETGRYRFNITVHPDFERRGVGTAVYDHIWQTIQARKPKPTMLSSFCFQHHPQSVKFLQKRGFQQVMRWVVSTLDVQAFDATNFAPLLYKMKAQGIYFITLPQLQAQNTNWLTDLHELDWQLSQDEPQPHPPQKMSQEQYRKIFVDGPNAIPEGWIIAVANGRLIGNSSLEKYSNPGVLGTGFTGVIRDYRRRGLATALKVQTIEYARAQDYRIIRTGNEENNPMLTLNKKLGFAELTASLAFEKRLMDVIG